MKLFISLILRFRSLSMLAFVVASLSTIGCAHDQTYRDARSHLNETVDERDSLRRGDRWDLDLLYDVLSGLGGSLAR